MTIHEEYMRQALQIAETAMGHTNPNPMVGCVVVKDGRIISIACHEKCGEYHAERNALTRCKEDTKGADLYVTLEPCIMCMGALIQSRISHIYFGANDYKGGAIESSINVLDAKNINHHPVVEGGILKEECSRLLSEYLKLKRETK